MRDKASIYPFILGEISLFPELTLGHLRYHVANVPPQPNSPSAIVYTQLVSLFIERKIK
jgi:hypothetical protein